MKQTCKYLPEIVFIHGGTAFVVSSFFLLFSVDVGGTITTEHIAVFVVDILFFIGIVWSNYLEKTAPTDLGREIRKLHNKTRWM